VAPLQQLNLKVPAAVLDHWRAQAAAAAMSVRDWLVSIAGPAAAAAPDPAGDPDLLARVEALEAAVLKLRKAMPTLPAPPSPSGALPGRRLTLEEADGLRTTAQVAAALGITAQAVVAWMERQQGGRPGAVGMVWRGFRLLGMGQLPGGQRPVWLFEPVD
jgi:hypothetical protein